MARNLGHSELLTTLMSYGAVPDDRQADLIARLSDRPLSSKRNESGEAARLIELALAKLRA